MRRSAPRSLATAVEAVARRSAPATSLAHAQECWATAVGAGIARKSRPVAERGGVLTVACASATWAHELELLAGAVLEAVNDAIERDGHGRQLTRLKLVIRDASEGVEGAGAGP